MLTGGDVAFGEGYFNGLWDTPDLPALLTLLRAIRTIDARVLRARLEGGYFDYATFCAPTVASKRKILRRITIRQRVLSRVA